jgi:hypothetical protein
VRRSTAGLAIALGIASVAAEAKGVTSDGAGAYATGKYRNLFVEAGHTEQEVEARIARAFEQLFRGDLETQRLYFPSGENENGALAYVPDIQHTDVRSEGMSYGMMITVQLDRKPEFDALWNWSMTHMYQKDPKHPSFGFFSWQMNDDGTVMDELPAPDGEEYYAMALLFAANRWGNGRGLYDYQAHANRLLHDMVHREPITGMVRQRGALGQHTVGKEVNEEHGMILFSPDERSAFTDPSYHLPAFYELWARWGPKEDRAFWARAATVRGPLEARRAVEPRVPLLRRPPLHDEPPACERAVPGHSPSSPSPGGGPGVVSRPGGEPCWSYPRSSPCRGSWIGNSRGAPSPPPAAATARTSSPSSSPPSRRSRGPSRAGRSRPSGATASTSTST